MDFRILGPLEVSEAGKALRLPGSKARAVLSILLLHANEAVSMERLIDELWGENPPETAANTLQVHVSQLRKALPRGKDVLLTRGRGYLLKVEPEALDLARFEQLSRDARSDLAAGNPIAAAGKLREALDLWRGPPLADLSGEFAAQPEIARLEEEHLVALEDRIEADLALARHDAVIGELEEIVAAHPLRERPRRMLMLALYRSGRQAEALALYQKTRRELVEELGIEPSPALQRLEKAILMQDPSLDAPRPPAVEPAEAAPEEPSEAALPPRESRRTVTVVYADLAASAETGRLDPETRVRVVARAAEAVSDAIARHGGSTEAVVGDALLGVFGIPNVYEDDALRAVRAAAEARESLVVFGEELERDRGIVLDARFGVSTGELVTTGALPVRGEPVSDSSRLAQTAPTSGVILDAATERLVLNAVRVKPVGRRSSGGPVSSWLLSEVLEGAPAFTRRLDAPMVGRESELAQLRRAFEQAVRDQTAYLFTVLGPAGIGKSRLANELRSSLADEAAVLSGRCLPYGTGITFWPLAEVVGQVAGDDPRAGIVELLSDEEDGGLVAERIAGALGVADSAAGSDETFWAVRKLLEGLARERPLVIVFDDIHWGEPTFLDLIEHVADLSRSSPILIVCLARPELLEDRALWGGGKLNASTILLGPLSEQETAVLMEQLAGEAAVDARLRARVAEAAEGNPLFIEQMLAMLSEAEIGREQLRIPPTIHALLAARLSRLEGVERAILEQASVIGKEFGSRAVEELLEAEAREGLTSRLHALVRKDLLLPAGSIYGDEGFRFRHHLIRDAAYESLPKQARAEAHERFAGWLEETAPERARENEEIVGYHLEQAYRYLTEFELADDHAASLAERAVERLASAGRRAYNRDDPPAAVNLLSRAASLVPEGSGDWAELMAGLGEAEREAGDFQRADSTLERAIQAAAAVGDRTLEWRTRSVRLQVRKQLPEITAEEIGAEAERTREALAELGDERGLANAWWMVAWSKWLRCRAAETESALEHAIEFARRADAWRAEAQGLNLLLGAGLFGPLPVDRAIRRSQKVLREHVDQRRFEASAYRVLAVLNAMRGDFDQARELVTRDRGILEDLGLRFQAAAATEGYGMVELLAGNPQAAEDELRRGYDILVQMGTTATIANVSAVLAQATYAGGRNSEALKFSEISQEAAAADDLSAQIQWRGPRAKVLARRGRKKKAEELGVEAVTLAAQTDFLNQHGEALMDLAEVHRLGERPRDAVRVAEQAVKLFERKGNIVSASRGKVFVRSLARDAREARRAAGTAG
jgi:DNA-binding SARP family transcriptional activator